MRLDPRPLRRTLVEPTGDGLAWGPRFDLGLLELMFVRLLIVGVRLVAGRTTRPDSTIAALALLYPPIRFPLDFLRASAAEGGDVRYFGLTPGQYASVGLFAVCLWLLGRTFRSDPIAEVTPCARRAWGQDFHRASATLTDQGISKPSVRTAWMIEDGEG